MPSLNITIAFVAAIAAFPVASNEPSTQQQTSESTDPALGPHQTYTDVVVIEFESLSGPTKREVEAIIADTNADELQELQALIGDSRQALLTLAAAGRNPTHVLAAGVTSDGVLTLVVQQTA